MQKSVTIRDVAEAAGVSSATVSYVLNGRRRISPVVAEKVRDAAARLGYVPNPSALALRTGRSGVIACVVPTLASPIFPEIAIAVQEHARTHGMTMLLVDAGNNREEEVAALQMLAQRGVDGVVAVLAPAVRRHHLPDLPTVVLDSPVEGLDCVRADHRHGGALAAKYLLRQGHQRVGLLSGDTSIFSSRERRSGFVEHAAPMQIVWEEAVPLEPRLPIEAAERLARREVSAVFCVNDVVAIGALGAARDLGLSVPGDLSIIGFDDIQLSAWPLVAMTTVRQDLRALGARAVDLLMLRVAERERPVEEVVIEVSITIRVTA